MIDDQTVIKFTTYMEKYPELYENLADIVNSNISKSAKNPVIVDLGCGPGLLSSEIIKKIPKSIVIGIDISEKMLEVAKEKDGEIQTIKGSSEKILLNNNYADIIVSRFSLPYWEKPQDCFNEIHRVLKTGGRVVLECLNKDFSKWRLFLIKIHMYLKFAGAPIVRYHIDAYKTAYTMSQVKQFLKKSKLKIIRSDDDTINWKFLLIAEKNK